MERIVFFGPGRVGLSLGYALAQSGGEVSLQYQGRRPDPPGHPLFHQGLAEYRFGLELPEPGTTAILLTVPDAALPELAHALAGLGDAPPGCAAFHCSGAHGADLLAPLHARGYPVGTLHPLQAVANSLDGAERFRGSFFSLSGEPQALITAHRLVSLLGGRGIAVPTSRRPLYHAAAVMASNHLVILLREAVGMFMEAGASSEEAQEALLSLARGTLDNVEAMGLRGALTGPLVRGDVDTVELHLRKLSREDAALYAALGRRGLAWIEDALSPETAARFEELFARHL